jgi:hypothetical protein
MKNDSFRQLAITILDDEHGITETAYDLLYEQLIATGNKDISDVVVVINHRFFLNEDDAATLKQKGHNAHLFNPDNICTHCGVAVEDDAITSPLCSLMLPDKNI